MSEQTPTPAEGSPTPPVVTLAPDQEQKLDGWSETKEFLDGLKQDDMEKVVMDLKDEMRRLAIENIVFENFLQSHEPTLISGMAKTLDKAADYCGPLTSNTSIRTVSVTSETKIDTQSIESGVRSILERRFMSKIRGPRINFTMKTDLVMREIENTQLRLVQFQEYAHRKKNRLKAEIEENTIRGGELADATNNFEQQIVIEAVEKLTQKIPAEKFVRYMQEWLKSAQIMLEKLRLRTNSLRTQERKLKVMKVQKEDLGECVHEVDFEKLGIENKNFLLEIEQKNNNMLELKQMNGKANLMLTTHKNFLHKQDDYRKDIVNQMKLVEKQTKDLGEVKKQTKIELAKKRKKYETVKSIVAKYRVPDVMEYILKKNQLHEYRKQLKVWKRKVNIQTIVMHTYVKIMCHLTNSPKPKTVWYTKKNLGWQEDEETSEPDEGDDMMRDASLSSFSDMRAQYLGKKKE